MKRHNLSLVHNVREPKNQSSALAPLLLLLHGIGSNEDDLFSLSPYLDRRCLIVSARAPIVMGPASFGWFNIEFTPQGLVADVAEAEQSRLLLLKFIDEIVETYPVDPDCIFLAGFSQGAMMSLSVALSNPKRVKGLVAMSGRLPAEVMNKITQPEELAEMPIFVSHGLYDAVIPIELGRECRHNLERLPVALTYREYPMGHEVSNESLRDVVSWFAKTLDENGVSK
jgi:phospholipase/carboxylesterase